MVATDMAGTFSVKSHRPDNPAVCSSIQAGNEISLALLEVASSIFHRWSIGIARPWPLTMPWVSALN